jgi:hypothetical protein
MSAVKIVTPPCTARFTNLDEHASFDGVSTGKYTVTFFVDPKDAKSLEDACQEAGGGQGNNPLVRIPDDAQYDAGKVRFKASSKYAVKVVGKNKEVVENSTVEGAVVRAAITFADYQAAGNRGVTVYLNGIQVLEPGSSSVDFGELPEGYSADGEFNDPLPF